MHPPPGTAGAWGLALEVHASLAGVKKLVMNPSVAESARGHCTKANSRLQVVHLQEGGRRRAGLGVLRLLSGEAHTQQ